MTYEHVTVSKEGTDYIIDATAETSQAGSRIKVSGGTTQKEPEKSESYLIKGSGGLDTNGRYLKDENGAYLFENIE